MNLMSVVLCIRPARRYSSGRVISWYGLFPEIRVVKRYSRSLIKSDCSGWVAKRACGTMFMRRQSQQQMYFLSSSDWSLHSKQTVVSILLTCVGPKRVEYRCRCAALESVYTSELDSLHTNLVIVSGDTWMYHSFLGQVRHIRISTMCHGRELSP